MDRNKRLADLTAAETAQLCDDTATSIGGYGKEKTVTCNGTTLTMKAPASQAECVSNSKVPKTCAATVGQVEDCRDHEMACSQDQSSCAALVECATTTDGG